MHDIYVCSILWIYSQTTNCFMHVLCNDFYIDYITALKPIACVGVHKVLVLFYAHLCTYRIACSTSPEGSEAG